MIVKISASGNHPGGLMKYLVGPGKANEHDRPHVVTGSLAFPGLLTEADAEYMSNDLQAFARQFGTKLKNGHIWHCSLALGAEEGKITDARWKGIADDFMRQMGFTDPTKAAVRWTAVHHGQSAKDNDHIHIVASVVRQDGTKVSTWNDMVRASKIAVGLEEKYGLNVLAGRRVGVSTCGYSKDDSGRSKTVGSEPRRIELERRVRACAISARSEEQFISALTKNGLQFKPYRNKDGGITGYSVNLPETATGTKEHWWAGGKLARDLSLPRLRQGWADKTTNKPSHIKAVDELVSLQQRLPGASAEELTDASHQLAGALAAVSEATENPPGDLAAASHHAGTFAQTRTYVWKPKPPALSIGLLFLQSLDPEGPVGKTVMLKQLMATYRALLDAQFAQRALATTKGGIPSMSEAPEEEMVQIGVTTAVTAGALVMERHARTKEARAKNGEGRAKHAPLEPWDAKKIRQMRIENEWVQAVQRAAHRPVPGRMTQEQYDRINQLAIEFELPSMMVGIDRYTKEEAETYIKVLEAHSTGHIPERVALQKTALQESDEVEAFMADLESKHGDKVDARAKKVDLNDPSTWSTGAEPATEAQRKWLTTQGGLSQEEATKMTKAGASSFRTQMEQRNTQAVALTPTQTAKNGPAKGRSL